MSDTDTHIANGFGSSDESADDGFGSETCSSEDESENILLNLRTFNEFLERTWVPTTVRTTYSTSSTSSAESLSTIFVECPDEVTSMTTSLENIPEGKRKRRHMPTWTGSKARRLLGAKKSLHLRDTEIEKVFNIGCKCGNNCSRHVTSTDVVHERAKYWEQNGEQDRTEYLVMKLGVDGVKNLELQKFQFRYVLNNTMVCGPFFEKAIGVSHKKSCDVRRRVVEERFQTVRRTKKNNGGARGRKVIEFIKLYAIENGNVQPTIKECTDPKAKDIHLPHGVRKEDVYISYRASMTSEEALASALHISSFYQLWRETLQQIVCRAHQKFAQCRVCSQLKFRIQRGTPSNRGTVLPLFPCLFRCI